MRSCVFPVGQEFVTAPIFFVVIEILRGGKLDVI